MSLGMEPGGKMIISGAMCITGTPRQSTFTIGVILILVTLFVVLNLINSRDGRAIMAIRDNVIAAESIGINVTKYKLMAFTISAAMAGAAGVLYAHNLFFLTAFFLFIFHVLHLTLFHFFRFYLFIIFEV